MSKRLVLALTALTITGVTLPLAAIAQASDDQAVVEGTGIERLSAVAGAYPRPRVIAMYDSRPTKAGDEEQLWVMIKGHRPFWKYPVVINGKPIGMIYTDKAGVGEAKFRASPGVPGVLPPISSGTMLAAGLVKAWFE